MNQSTEQPFVLDMEAACVTVAAKEWEHAAELLSGLVV